MKILRDTVDVPVFNRYLGRSLSNQEHESVYMALVSAPDAGMFLRHISALGLPVEKVGHITDALHIASLAQNKAGK